MKEKLNKVIALLALLYGLGVYGQMPFGNLETKWNTYKERSASEGSRAPYRRFFRDTVSVQEMKEAFFKNKDIVYRQSPYEGFDSVVYFGGYGESVMLISPLKDHKDKEVRECRGTWNIFNKLITLHDKNGVEQKELAEKLKSDYRWIKKNREFIKLGHPRWYMGFVVSPRIYWDIYDEGRLLARLGYLKYNEPDFFTYANYTHRVLDGNWDSLVEGGARLMGVLHTMKSSANMNMPQRVFSVLLYEVPKTKKSSDVSYTLELLHTENPDKETIALFQNFKRFVEDIPEGAFKPLYTTDFRIMTGRYYRVTVDKCGWLVEDYLGK